MTAVATRPAGGTGGRGLPFLPPEEKPIMLPNAAMRDRIGESPCAVPEAEEFDVDVDDEVEEEDVERRL